MGTEVTLELTGTRPMLMHNGRLANPLDPYAQRLKAYTSKRNKTDEDLMMIMKIEARGSCWETPDGLLAVPEAAVWACLHEAAKQRKLGKSIEKALRYDPDSFVPIEVDGEQVSCDDYLRDLDNIDYRGVKVNGRRVMRSRPRIRHWSGTVTFDLDENIINARDLAPTVEYMGEYVGLGDWRPQLGTFAVAIPG